MISLIWFAIAPGAGGQGYSPDEAVRHMSLPEDLQAQFVAGEPMITQPACIEFDDRGRLWVMQYLQYPNPSGLKRAEVDRWSRTKYDHVPEPPPRGQRERTALRFSKILMAMVALTSHMISWQA